MEYVYSFINICCGPLIAIHSNWAFGKLLCSKNSSLNDFNPLTIEWCAKSIAREDIITNTNKFLIIVTGQEIHWRDERRNWRPRNIDEREKQFFCPNCHRGYKHRSHMYRHCQYECGKPPRFQCPYCEARSKHKFNLYSHIKNHHPGCSLFAIDTVEPNQ